MKKLIKNEICGSMNSVQMHCSLKNQHLLLLFMQQCMNSNRIPPKTREKKKKTNEGKRNFSKRRRNQCYPNEHYIT